MDEPSHLAAIAAAPDDDAPRLAYADWLRSNGRAARADFIRTQIARHLTGSLFCADAELELAKQPGALAGVPDWASPVTAWEFSRGFFDQVKLASLSELFDRVPDLLAIKPTPRRLQAGDRSVRLSSDGARVARRDGTSEITESGRVSYASGISELTVYGTHDRAAIWSASYPYHWNDGDRPAGSEQLDDFWFSPDGRALMVRFVSAPGVRPHTTRVQTEVLP